MKYCRCFLTVLTALLVSSCANIHQVQRARLARRCMQFDPVPNLQSFVNDANAFREGAAGGPGQRAGGGCGCN